MLDREKFAKALAELAGRHSRGECFVLFSSPWDGTIELPDRDSVERLMADGLTEQEVRAATRQITDLILAALRDGLDEFVALQRNRFRRGGGDDDDAGQDDEEYRLRFEQVKAALVDDRLKRRYQLKRLSKAPAFSDIDWDVKIKVEDAAESDFHRFPYATVKLKYEREFDLSPLLPLLQHGGGESIQVNFTSDEISYLISSLGRARAALERAELEGGSEL